MWGRHDPAARTGTPSERRVGRRSRRSPTGSPTSAPWLSRRRIGRTGRRRGRRRGRRCRRMGWRCGACCAGRGTGGWLVGARLVTVLAPPRVDPDGAAALWGQPGRAGPAAVAAAAVRPAPPVLRVPDHPDGVDDPDLGARPGPARPGRTRRRRRLARRDHPHQPRRRRPQPATVPAAIATDAQRSRQQPEAGREGRRSPPAGCCAWPARAGCPSPRTPRVIRSRRCWPRPATSRHPAGQEPRTAAGRRATG